MTIDEALHTLSREVEKLKAELKSAREKVSDYENRHILPLFDSAKRLGFDLGELTTRKINDGKGCARVYWEHVEARILQQQAALNKKPPTILLTKEESENLLAVIRQRDVDENPFGADAQCQRQDAIDAGRWRMFCELYFARRADMTFLFRQDVDTEADWTKYLDEAIQRKNDKLADDYSAANWGDPEPERAEKPAGPPLVRA